MNEPKVSHMKDVRKIPRYLKLSINCGILFPQYSESKEVMINFYSDGDWCGDQENRRSTTSYFFQAFSFPISWCSRKQLVVTILSSCQTEYIEGSYVSCQAI